MIHKNRHSEGKEEYKSVKNSKIKRSSNSFPMILTIFGIFFMLGLLPSIIQSINFPYRNEIDLNSVIYSIIDSARNCLILVFIVMYGRKTLSRLEDHSLGRSNIQENLLILEKNSSDLIKLDAKEITKIDLINSLQERMSRITFRNDVVLLFIASILIAAVVIIIFAGKLTSLDIAAVSATEKLQNEVKETEARIFQVSKHIEAIKQHRRAESNFDDYKNRNPGDKSSQDFQELKKSFDSQSQQLAATRASTLFIPEDLQGAENFRNFYEERRKELNKHLYQSLSKDVDREKEGIDPRFLFATAITRIGVVLIIVFLVQILLGLYRYSTRLNTYYSSIADIVRIWDGNHENLKMLLTTFGPPKVDFGKEPKHPLEDIIRAVEKQLEKRDSTIHNETK